MSNYERHILGKQGEDVACNYIQKEEYKILERNFRCHYGEIDIIAKDKNEIVFIEVKTRKNKFYGSPRESVDALKQRHIYNASRFFLYTNKMENVNLRFDIIEIYKKEKYYINHIKNVEIQH